MTKQAEAKKKTTKVDKEFLDIVDANIGFGKDNAKPKTHNSKDSESRIVNNWL